MLRICLSSIVSLLVAGAGAASRAGNSSEDSDFQHVLIGYKSYESQHTIRSRVENVHRDFASVKALSAVVLRSKIPDLENDPNVVYVEEDGMLYPTGETVPYGIRLTQAADKTAMIGPGTGVPTTTPVVTASSSCADEGSFKIGIVDSGLAPHPDFPCLPKNHPQTNCIGWKSSSLNEDEEWYNPRIGHGNHVAGTIGAMGNNHVGVTSMVNDGNVCYLIARVFGEEGGALTSIVLEAVNWIVSKGGKVINLSLGGGSRSLTAQNTYHEAREAGVLVIASAGNSGQGGESYRYPASYHNVTSVAAVDEDKIRADFSQYNNLVDLAAPGVQVVSTIPPSSPFSFVIEVEIDGSNENFMGKFLEGSPIPNGAVAGPLIYCEEKTEPCVGPGGHVCLIERGGISFVQKARNCQVSQGIAAIIYNNEAGIISGTLGDDDVTIPVASVSQSSGHTFLDRFQGKEVHLTAKSGYAFYSGTSMAAPHVTGATALIWRLCPACTADDVEFCLQSTASDLGPPGKDKYFGYGLLQTHDAFVCLKSTVKCCHNTNPSPPPPPNPPPPSTTPSAPPQPPGATSPPSVPPTPPCRAKRSPCVNNSQCCSKKCKKGMSQWTKQCK